MTPEPNNSDQFAWLRTGEGPKPQQLNPTEVALDLTSQAFRHPTTGVALRICDWMDGRDLQVFVNGLQGGRIESGQRKVFPAKAGPCTVHVVQDWWESPPLEVAVTEGKIVELACFDNRFTFPLFWWVNLAMMTLNPKGIFRVEKTDAEPETKFPGLTR